MKNVGDKTAHAAGNSHPIEQVLNFSLGVFIRVFLWALMIFEIVVLTPTSAFSQSFAVSTFSPWSGYAIPNGVWLTGDFNGDGKADIFHAVASGDYAHTWTSNGDGSFSMSTFRPWAGYAIPNGVWLTGDFNGDGKADVFHAVASGDYAHTWTSNGDGSFSMSTFRPWSGYAIPNGVWLAGDLDRDGKTDVLHAVANTDYAHIWRSLGSGIFSVTSFSPWAGYAIPNGIWLSADVTGDRKTDIVHAVQNTDYVHTWISGFPAPGELALDGLEVTQAIQDMTHSVTLVADKTTWVRAYLSAATPSPVTVRGTLTCLNTATGVSTTINSTASTTIDPNLNSQLRPKRESITASLNFTVPNACTVDGERVFALASVTNTNTGAVIPSSNFAVASRTISFVHSSPMRVRIIGLQYTTGTPPHVVVNSPRAIDFTLLQSWLHRAYPISQLISSQNTLNASANWPFTCNDANAQLAALRATEIGNGTTDQRMHYFGLVSNGGGFMRGCAAGIPSTEASGPTGASNGTTGQVPVNVNGDPDASYGDWYGGHELGHTYGRFHPGFCNGNSSDDPSFPYPNGQLSTNNGEFTGLDVGDSANGIQPSVLPGASRYDIMTYCNQPQWPSAYSYEGIRSRLNAENPAGTGAPSAGATTAKIARSMVPNRDMTYAQKIKYGRSSAPRIATGLKSAPVPLLLWEAEPPLPKPLLNRAQPSDSQQVKKQDSLFAPAMPAPPPVQRGYVPSQRLEVQVSAQPFAEVKKGDFVSIIATVNLTKNDAKIFYVSRVSRASIPAKINDRRASIRLKDAKGKVIIEYPVNIQESTDVPPGGDRTALIDAVIPYSKTTALIELILSGKVKDTRRISKNIPSIKAIRFLDAQEKYPGIAGGTIVGWEAQDVDGDSLTYTVEVKSPEGKWETIAIGLKTPEILLTPEQAKRYDRSDFRVIANDGFNNSLPVKSVLKSGK